MKLSALFTEETILVHPACTNFMEAATALAEVLKSSFDELEPEAAAKALCEIEKTKPTIVEDDICLGHLRREGVKEVRGALAVLKDEIDHPSGAKARTRILFLIIAPQEQNTLMIQTLAGLERLLTTQKAAQTLRSAKSAGKIHRLIEESGIEVKHSLTVGDIMEPVCHSVTMDTPLRQATEILARARDEGVPVLNEKGKLAGELTTRELLILGMPKYMDLLANPEMLNAFEPFENYFRNEDTMSVRDICRRDFVTAEPSDLVVRVAHQMVTANRRRIYVLDDDKLVGIVYRKSIVESVMNR